MQCLADGGTFTLTFRQHTTRPISFNATSPEVKAALEALSSLTKLTGNHVIIYYKNILLTITLLLLLFHHHHHHLLLFYFLLHIYCNNFMSLFSLLYFMIDDELVTFIQDSLPPNGTLSYIKPLKETVAGIPPWGHFGPDNRFVYYPPNNVAQELVMLL